MISSGPSKCCNTHFFILISSCWCEPPFFFSFCPETKPTFAWGGLRKMLRTQNIKEKLNMIARYVSILRRRQNRLFWEKHFERINESDTFSEIILYLLIQLTYLMPRARITLRSPISFICYLVKTSNDGWNEDWMVKNKIVCSHLALKCLIARDLLRMFVQWDRFA